ncbi:hypothetical protein Tco_0828758 [Tanacetum coccineum]
MNNHPYHWTKYPLTGFLDNNSKEKNKNKDDLAAKITNVDRKVIGRRVVRGIPLDTNVGDSVMETKDARHSNAHVYVGGQPLKSILKSNPNKKRVSNVVGDVPGDVKGVSKAQVEDVIMDGRSKAVGVSFASMVSEPVS